MIITVFLTPSQRNLISKLGNFAFPFSLAFPELSSPSYSLMMGWQDQGSLMGLEYEAMGFVGSNEHDMQERSVRVCLAWKWIGLEIFFLLYSVIVSVSFLFFG